MTQPPQTPSPQTPASQTPPPPGKPGWPAARRAKFQLGQVVKHRLFAFRGVIFDVDPTFSNTEEWWLSIPEEIRPRKDQPFYHLLAENDKTEYVAYVSEQNLLVDDSDEPVQHSQIGKIFGPYKNGHYAVRAKLTH